MIGAVEVLKEIRDLIAHRGIQRRPGDANQPTMPGGIETPYAMADVSIGRPTSLVGKGSYAAVGQTSDVHHYTSGEIIIAVTEHKPAGIFFYAAEIQVMGAVSGQLNILATIVVNNATGPALVPVPIGQAYTYFSVKARQLVNGIPSDAFPGNDPLMAGASLEVTASGRFYR